VDLGDDSEIIKQVKIVHIVDKLVIGLVSFVARALFLLIKSLSIARY